MTNQSRTTCRIGIIGAGRIGKLHAENIQHKMPQYELCAIADPNMDGTWARSQHIPIITENSTDILSNPDIDAVIIASPSHLHIEQIALASQAGKAIFCEKPLGLLEADIRAILQTVINHNTLLQVGFNRRFDPSFASLQTRVQSGEIGAPHLLRITSRDPSCPPKEYCATSGGIFMDMTIHDFDMARFLMSSEIVEVYASGSVLINPDFETYNDVDTAIVQMRFANGALAVIDNSRQAVYGYDQRVEVFGTTGMLLANNQLENTVKHYSKAGTQEANPLHFFLERYEQAYLAELKSFYDSWLHKKPASVTGEDGLQALRIANAANQSMRTNQPVKINQEQ